MKTQNGLVVALAIVALAVLSSTASADFVVGAGDNGGISGYRDWSTDYNIPVWGMVDASTPVTLAAGTYQVTNFNYIFGYADSAPSTSAGSVTPFLTTWDGSTIAATPVAVGNAVAYAGPTTWTSATFGGSDTFTLASTTTLYAGYAWEVSSPVAHQPYSSPIGQADGTNPAIAKETAEWYSTALPVVGTPLTQLINGGTGLPYALDGADVRQNFSLTVTAVPEPGTIMLLATGLIGLLCYAWRKRK